MISRERELEILLEFIESTYFSQSVAELLKSSSDFFVNRFRLANCYLELLGKHYRFFTNNEISTTYAKLEGQIKLKLEKNRIPIFLQNFGESNSIEHKLSAFPIVLDKELIGSIYLYGNQVFESELALISQIISKLVKAAITVKNFAEVKHSAITDTMTGLYNKTYFSEILKQEISRAKSSREATSLMILDIDDFKEYNDTKGHLEGDVLLKDLAGILRYTTDQTFTVSRFGGEEFVVLLPSTSSEGAYAWAEKLRIQVSDSLPTKISIGVCTCINSSASSSEMMKNADIALYKSKRRGKNQTTQKLIVDRSIGVIDVDR